MNEDNIIQWNITNWITVVLMGVVAFMVFGLIGGAVGSMFNGGGGQPDAALAA